MSPKTRTLWFKAIGVWFLLMTAETFNGLWRAKVLALWIGDFPARQVSVFTGSLLVLWITYECIRWIPATNTRTLLFVGLTWAVLTLALELSFGRFRYHRSWEEIGWDFDMLHGGMFPIGLAILTFAPLRAARWRERSTMFDLAQRAR